MKKSFFVAIALIAIMFSCKKDPVTPSDEPVIVDNLDNLAISALAVDGTNKLWVATNNGLYKEVDDGYLLINLGTTLHVTALNYESSNNSIWAGTEAGIYKVMLGETEIAGDSVSSDLLSNDTIMAAFIDENSVRWFGTKTGITRNENENWQKDKFRSSIGGTTDLAFADDAVTSIGAWDGNYFFATAGHKLWRTSNWDESVDAFTGATMWDPPYNGMAITDTMYAVFIDSRGLQWFGGQEGVQFHSGDDPKADNQSFKDELVDENVHCIAEDPSGNIWCGTENGISIFDGNNWNASNAALSNNFVTSIIFQGNTAWVGTKMGLNKIAL